MHLRAETIWKNLDGVFKITPTPSDILLLNSSGFGDSQVYRRLSTQVKKCLNLCAKSF